MPRTFHILCIEDDTDAGELLAFILRRHGYDVTVATGGQAGIDALRQRRPDLVLLDLMMPQVDGWTVFGFMRADEHLKEVPVIAVTAKSHSIDRVIGLRMAQVDDYITKPYAPDDLLRRVARVLRRDDEPNL